MAGDTRQVEEDRALNDRASKAFVDCSIAKGFPTAKTPHLEICRKQTTATTPQADLGARSSPLLSNIQYPSRSPSLPSGLVGHG